MIDIFIRKAEQTDAAVIADLFENTILHVNKADYSLEQTILWASAKNPLSNWEAKIKEQCFLVAEIKNQIVGFSSLEQTGYVDLMYVHKDFQKQGIASFLFQALLEQAKKHSLPRLYSEVSITAKPFFEKQGFELLKEQKKCFKGTTFINYIMEKYL